jgi:hypothetical protein
LSKADEIWKALGYRFGHTQWGGLRLKKDDDNIFIFNEENKSFYKTGEYDSMCDNITMQELQAINLKVKELRLDRRRK